MKDRKGPTVVFDEDPPGYGFGFGSLRIPGQAGEPIAYCFKIASLALIAIQDHLLDKYRREALDRKTLQSMNDYLAVSFCPAFTALLDPDDPGNVIVNFDPAVFLETNPDKPRAWRPKGKK